MEVSHGRPLNLGDYYDNVLLPECDHKCSCCGALQQFKKPTDIPDGAMCFFPTDINVVGLSERQLFGQDLQAHWIYLVKTSMQFHNPAPQEHTSERQIGGERGRRRLFHRMVGCGGCAAHLNKIQASTRQETSIPGQVVISHNKNYFKANLQQLRRTVASIRTSAMYRKSM